MSDTASLVRDRETARLVGSGWLRIAALAARLPVSPVHYVEHRPRRWWNDLADLIDAYRQWLNGFRFAEDTEIGLLFVPAPLVIDTRAPIDTPIRRHQCPDLDDDFFDRRLDAGIDLVPDGANGQFFLTCVGRYGISAGSHHSINAAPAAQFQLDGTDTRQAMTRQLWGARVLQAGHQFRPDSEENPTWTFTVFAGHPLIDGQAASGTILKSRVRFRLGKPDRGIASARSAPPSRSRPCNGTVIQTSMD